MGPTILSNPYHILAIKNFNKDLASHFMELVDEMKLAAPEYFPTKLAEDGKPDWVPVKVFATSLPFVCRCTNRTFVGETICRLPEWIQLNIKYTIDVFLGAQLISLFPTFLQPSVSLMIIIFQLTIDPFRLAGKYLTTAPRRRRQALKHLKPLIEERYRLLEKEGKNGTNVPVSIPKFTVELTHKKIDGLDHPPPESRRRTGERCRESHAAHLDCECSCYPLICLSKSYHRDVSRDESLKTNRH